MKKRVIDLREGGRAPLLDIVSYGRGGKSLTPAQKELIALTVRRVPEVMVKVSGGARTVAGVERHMNYIGREGKLGLEADTGEHLDGKGFERQLTEDWDLDLEAHERQTERSIRGRKPPKLVHNIIFSMPPGTPSDKVLQAVRKLALNEWQLKHRYAMVLHTDDDHPHVHVVVKAVANRVSGSTSRRPPCAPGASSSPRTFENWALRPMPRNARCAERRRPTDPTAPIEPRSARARPSSKIESSGSSASGLRARSNWRRARSKLQKTREDVIDGWRGVSARLKADGELELRAEC